MTRAICVLSRQSTTNTLSTNLRQRGDSTNKGTSKTKSACPAWMAACACACVANPTKGCTMASSRNLALGSEKTSARMRSLSSAPSGVTNSLPKASAIAGMAGPLAAVTLRAIASESITAAPRAASIWATVLLPLPMPPVKPSRRGELAVIATSLCKKTHPPRPKMLALHPLTLKKGQRAHSHLALGVGSIATRHPPMPR